MKKKKQLSAFGVDSEKSWNSLWLHVYCEELRKKKRSRPQTPQEESGYKNQTTNQQLLHVCATKADSRKHVFM